MNGFVTVFYDWSRIVASYFTWLAPLAVRLAVGMVFIDTGWKKLNNLPQIIQNFTALGIPAPHILTPFVSGVEFFGGLLLFVGLLTRFAAVPLMVVMVVAIVSAQLGDVHTVTDFLGLEEFSYFLMFAWLAIAGPGPASADHFVLKASGRDPAAHGS
jgi:putative oxidoreductase